MVPEVGIIAISTVAPGVFSQLISSLTTPAKPQPFLEWSNGV
jgi:hypothetical protein